MRSRPHPVRRPRVLFLAPRYPLPAMRGDQLRVLHLARGVASRADVRLLSFGGAGEPEVQGVRSTRVARGVLPAAFENATHPSPLVPLQVRLYLDARLRRLVRRTLREFSPDVLHVSLARMEPYAAAAPEDVHVHLDLIDSLSLNMQTRAASAARPARTLLALEARLMRSYEAGAARRADSTSVVSEQDRAVPGLEGAAVLPNGVDVASIPFGDPRVRPPAITFFGNLGYFHNVEPARFVAMEVLPRLRAIEPEAELRLAGARPTAVVKRLAARDGVELRADVPDMAAELHKAAVAVLPMFSGSGMKNKVLEAFCSGTPVVTNAAGIGGINGAEPGLHYLHANDADEFASACSRLLRDPDERSRLAGAAYELVRQSYGWEQRVSLLLGLYGLEPSSARGAGQLG